MFTFLYSLRFRLFLLLGLLLLPLLSLTLRTASAQRELAAAQAKTEALRMTRLVISNQNTLTAGGHHLLIALAQLPEIRSGDPAGCSALLAELLMQFPGYTNLGVAALNGDLLCSAIPTSGPINYADRAWFQRVLQTRNFVVGEYVIGRITGIATLPLAYPVVNEAGELDFVVFAGIDLEFVNQLVASAQFPEGTAATVLDRDGTILAHYPDPEQWVGKTPQDAPLVKAILTKGEGTVETTGEDGVQRLYAFAPLGEASHVEGYVAVGIPSQVAYAGVNRILFNNLIGLGLAAILTFAAAWLGGELFILRRTSALARTAQQLTSGDLSARTGITRPRGELSQLAFAFDEMAAALQEREEALRKSEAHYRAVVEDQTELICRFKPDGTLTFVNENYCRYYGKTNDELIGNGFIPLAHGDQPQKLREYLASFSREKPVATFEQQDVMPNGKMRWRQWTDRALFDKEGNILEFQSVGSDISERKRTEEEIKQRNRALALLNQVIAAASTTLEPKAVLEITCRELALALDVPQAAAALLNKEHTAAIVVAEYLAEGRPSAMGIVLPVEGNPATQYVLEHKAPLAAADAQHDPRLAVIHDKMRQRGTVSLLILPLMVGGEVVGTLGVDAVERREFTEEEITLAASATAAAAQALENARLFEAEYKARQISDTLSEIARELNIAPNMNAALDLVLSFMKQVISYDSASILLLENWQMSVAAVRGFKEPEQVLNTHLDLDTALLNKEVVETRRPMIVGSVADDPRWVKAREASGLASGLANIHSWMGVPLLVQDRVIGMLTADKVEPDFYQPEDAELALAFANHAAIAIENARLHTSLSKEKQRLELLYNLSRRLTESLDSHQVATKALDHICTALGAFKGVIYVPRPDIDRWELLAAVGMKPAEIETFNQYAGLPLTSGLTGWAATHKKTAIAPDVAKDKRWEIIPGFDEWVRSAMSAPLLAGNTIVGVLSLLSDQIAAFREEDVEIVQAAAAPVAVALQNARLYAAEKRRAERLAELSKLGVEIATLHEASTVLNILVTRAAAIMESATCTVMLIDTITNEAVLAAQTGLPEGTSPELRIPLELPLLCHSVESSQPIIIPDIDHDAPAMRAVLLRPDIRAFFAYPMLREGRAIGFITFSKLTPHTPSAEEVAACHLLAERAAVALENARLFEETTRSLNQVQALHTIDMTIASSFDLRLTLSIILEQTRAQLGVDAVEMLVYNPHTQMLDYAAGIGFRTTALQGTHLRLGQSYAGIAGLERKTIHMSNLREHKTDFLRSPNFRAEGFDTYFGVPLIGKGQLKGVLEVFHRSPLQPNQNWMDFLETLAKQAAIAIDNASLFSDLQSSNADLILAYNATIEGWSKALDLRDKETEGHTQRVTEMTLQLALGMGMGEAELVHVRRGALLHDIGKMGIPDSILHKSGLLTDEEWVIMRKHPQYAFEMLSPIAYLRPALDIPSYHHEKWDGTGYPRGLKGEQIPLVARIFAVVDVYDALISDRPYRKAWPEKKALNYIREQAEKHFDPKVVEAFLQVQM